MSAPPSGWVRHLTDVLAGRRRAGTRPWVEVRPPGGGYRVEMPGRPRLSTQIVELPEGHFDQMVEALFETKTVTYIATHIIYPDGLLHRTLPDALLDGARDQVVKGHTLCAEQRLTISGAPGREYVMLHAQGHVLVMRHVVARDRFHQIIVSGPVGIDTHSDTRRYLDSFTLVSL